MKTFKTVTDLIGGTPLLELTNIEKKYSLNATVLGKLEMFNPTGSAKDRVAMSMIFDAKSKGLINDNSVIIEPTSGNTGIGIASVAASLGLRAILTMPDTMSKERQDMLKAYGAEIVLTPGAKGMAGSVEKAEELAKEIPDSFIPGQFTNPANPEIHYKTTGPEIYKDTDGKVDIFVAGVGTGGTLSGTGRYLKEKNPSVKIVAVEPATSALLEGKEAGKHGIQGIGANFIPKTLDRNIYDEVIPVTDQEAFATVKEIAKQGILTGISSGAAAYAARILAQRPENKGKIIVALLPDAGDRYLSTGVYN